MLKKFFKGSINPMTSIIFLLFDVPYCKRSPSPTPITSISPNLSFICSINLLPRRSPEGSAETIPTLMLNYL